MAGIESLVDTSELKTTLWAKIAQQGRGETSIKYDRDLDVVTLLVVPKRGPIVVHYIDEHVGLLYDPDTMEVIGLRVESFNRSFLPKYSSLQRAWHLNDYRQLENFGDLIVAVGYKEPQIAKELSEITGKLVKRKGLDLRIPA